MNDELALKELQSEKQRLVDALKAEDVKFKQGLTSVMELRDAEARISDMISRIILEISFLRRRSIEQGRERK